MSSTLLTLITQWRQLSHAIHAERPHELCGRIRMLGMLFAGGRSGTSVCLVSVRSDVRVSHRRLYSSSDTPCSVVSVLKAVVWRDLCRRYHVEATAWSLTLLTVTSTTSCIYFVPQGLVLSPLLFILYVADLADIVAQYSLRLHAFTDDNCASTVNQRMRSSRSQYSTVCFCS